MRHTVRGILLKDRQILLVTGHGANFYWTPGGGVEGDESIKETLHREIHEELGVEVATHQHYYSYTDEDQKVDNFIITVNGEFHVGEEITGYGWYSTKSEIVASNGFLNALLPKLLEDGLIQ